MRDAANPAGPAVRQPFRLGKLTVDSVGGEISGPAGRERVDPKVMGVLLLLAHRIGQVVSRDELLTSVWPGLVVTDEALSRCIYQLRRHFVRAGGSTAYKTLVQTLPKRGYRLNGEAAVPVPPLPSTRPEALVRSKRFAFHALFALLMSIVLLTFSSDELLRDGTATANSRAYRFYLRGNDYFWQPDRRRGLPWAARQYERALQEDPEFALAWARLGIAHTAIYWLDVDRTPARLARAKTAIEQALVLQPDLPQAHVALGNYYFRGFSDYEAASTEFAIAEQSIPNDSLLLFLRSGMERRAGSWEQAQNRGERAIEADPDNVVYLLEHQVTAMFNRDYTRAEQILDGLRDTHPDARGIFWNKVFLALCRDGDSKLAYRNDAIPPDGPADDSAYTRWLAAIFQHDYANALAILDSTAEASIRDEDLRAKTPKASLYGRTFLLAGDEAEARRLFQLVAADLAERLASGSQESITQKPYWYLLIAEAQAAQGQSELALSTLQRSRDALSPSRDSLARSTLQLAGIVRVLVPAGRYDDALDDLADYLGQPGQWSIEGLREDPRLAPIRNDSRFLALVEKHGRR